LNEPANDEGALPPVHEGSLDDATLDALFADVAAAATLLAVIVKRGRAAEPPRSPAALEDARGALRSGAVRAVQLRYRHEGREWWDTISSSAPGRWRVVRIAHDFGPGAEAACAPPT
jgi:hypothetical protein